MTEKRTSAFAKNMLLETLLKEVNSELWLAEKNILPKCEPPYPIIFIMGPHRSGSTLLLQSLASTGLFSYPTNFLSRFYQAPIIGAKLQLLLTDKRYNYRNELNDISGKIDFQSDNGKTQGALAPNEFWYFWRRFLPFGELDYLSTEELWQKVDTVTFKAELTGIMQVLEKPLVLKGMILNYNIDFLDTLFEKALFIHCTRDLETNIASALEARERQLGNSKKWYSFKFPGYHELKMLEPYHQVKGQIEGINKEVSFALEKVAKHKKITVHYEDFCQNPNKILEKIKIKLNHYNLDIQDIHMSNGKFNISR